MLYIKILQLLRNTVSTFYIFSLPLPEFYHLSYKATDNFVKMQHPQTAKHLACLKQISNTFLQSKYRFPKPL